jgi:hypothetical protein
MRKALFLSIVALCAAPAFAAGSAQCDSTAFTLAKPSPPAPKVATPAAPVKQPQAQPATKKPIAKAKTSSRLFSTCKDGKKKSG